MLASLREFLISNSRFIHFEARFVVKGAKHLLAALVLFESNFGLVFLTFSYMETLMSDLMVQSHFPEVSVDEIISDMTETFSRNETETLRDMVKKLADETKSKFAKLFNSENGVYPSLASLKEVQFLYPHQSLSFAENYKFETLDQMSLVPASEMLLYRSKARIFESKISTFIDCTTEATEVSVRPYRTFGKPINVLSSHSSS